MRWFTADLHLGHKNIITHCNRPFSSVWEMDKTLIGNINGLVRGSDILYVLGDFAFRVSKEQARAYLARIHCRDVRLVRGNHDKRSHEDLFAAVYDMLETKLPPGVRTTLCHYAMLRWPASHRGAWHLYGHSHGQLSHPSPLALDVGVDCHNFLPLSEGDVTRIFLERR